MPGVVAALTLALALVPLAPAPRPALAFAPLPTSELDWSQVAATMSLACVDRGPGLYKAWPRFYSIC